MASPFARLDPAGEQCEKARFNGLWRELRAHPGNLEAPGRSRRVQLSKSSEDQDVALAVDQGHSQGPEATTRTGADASQVYQHDLVFSVVDDLRELRDQLHLLPAAQGAAEDRVLQVVPKSTHDLEDTTQPAGIADIVGDQEISSHDFY